MPVKNILIIDDEVDVGTLNACCIKGYRLTVAVSGEEAATAIRNDF